MTDKATNSNDTAEDRVPGLAPVEAARGLFTAYRDAIGRLDEALGRPF